MASKKINKNDNAAKVFIVISNSIEKVVQKTGMSRLDIIIGLKEDIINENKEGYTRQIEQISITGLSTKGKKDLVKYIDRIIKRETAKERTMKEITIEEQEIKRKKVEDRATAKAQRHEEEKAKKAAEEAIKRQEKIDNEWEKIKEEVGWTIEAEVKQDDFIDRSYMIPVMWRIARDRFLESKKTTTSFSKEILNRFNEEIFYQDVKSFTKGFSFLGEDYLLSVSSGVQEERRFKDMDSYCRFQDIRSKINYGCAESEGIRRALIMPGIDETTKRILMERQKAIKAQMKRKGLDREI